MQSTNNRNLSRSSLALILILFSSGVLKAKPKNTSPTAAANLQFVRAMEVFLAADKQSLSKAANALVLQAASSLRLVLNLSADKKSIELRKWGRLWGEFLGDPERTQKWLDQTKVLGAVVFRGQSVSSSKLKNMQVYYINGIRGSLIQAVKDKTILEKSLQENQQSVHIQAATYSLAFNPSNNALVDVLQSASQVSLDLSANELGSLLSPFGDFFKDVIEKVTDTQLRKKLQKFYDKVKKKLREQKGLLDQLSAGDLKEHVAEYVRDLDAGRKVLLVSHSQGALYANAGIQQIQNSEHQNAQNMGIYAVASPVGTLADGSRTYLTHDRDIIRFVPGAFQANFELRDKSGDRPDLALDALHFFSTYLDRTYNARERILGDIAKKMATI